MYSATTCIRNIPARKTKVLRFKENEDGKNIISPALIVPAVNISETNAEYLIVMATSGLRRENFSIEIAQSVISISAKKEPTPLSCVTDRCEYDYNNWTRAFALPADADGLFVRAEYRNGELTIHIPRNSTSEKPAKATIYVY